MKHVKAIQVTHNGQNICSYLMTPKAYKYWTLTLSIGDFHMHKSQLVQFYVSNHIVPVLTVKDLYDMGWIE